MKLATPWSIRLFDQVSRGADAARQGFDVGPISGVDLTALIEEMARTPKPIIDRVAALMRPPGAR